MRGGPSFIILQPSVSVTAKYMADSCLHCLGCIKTLSVLWPCACLRCSPRQTSKHLSKLGYTREDLVTSRISSPIGKSPCVKTPSLFQCLAGRRICRMAGHGSLHQPRAHPCVSSYDSVRQCLAFNFNVILLELRNA